MVYLNADEGVARANLLQRFAGLPYGPEDLEPAAAPVLVSAIVPEDDFVDVVTDAGCAAVNLPVGYPKDDDGAPVSHARCRPVGQAAWGSGLPGIACRSAAPASRPAARSSLASAGATRSQPLPSRRFSDWF